MSIVSLFSYLYLYQVDLASSSDGFDEEEAKISVDLEEYGDNIVLMT